MTVRVQNQRIKDAHPPKIAVAAEGLASVQEPRDRLFPAENSAGLGKSDCLRGEQGTFAHKLVVIHLQIIGYRVRANLPGKL